MKKAQITTFIILGVIILIMASTYMFIKGEIFENVDPGQITPPEFEQVHNYVDQCLKDTATESIRLIGKQGGYIEMPEEMRFDSAYLQPVPNGFFVPYWYKEGRDVSPTLSEIQKNIQTYTENNIDTCLDNFSRFSGFNISQGEPDILVIASDDDVQVKMFYPIEATKLSNNHKTELTDFSASINVRLKDLYEVSRSLLVDENENYFLENTAIDLMVLDDDIPFTGLNVECNRDEWKVSNIRERSKEQLYYNIPRIRVKGTDYVPFADDEEYEENKFLWDASLPQRFSDLEVGLKYEKDWPVEFSATPSVGDQMVSSKGNVLPNMLSKLCLNIYHFTYDFSFPVMVTVKDPDAFNTGFDFNIVIPGYIKSNEPKRKRFSSGIYETMLPDEEFCEDRAEKKYTITAKDSRTGLEIEDVNITFECVTKRCNMGATEFDGNSYKLETAFPSSCTGGFLKAEHPKYKDESMHVFTDRDETSIRFEMDEIKTLNMTVVKHKKENPLFEYEIDRNAIVRLINNNNSEFYMYPGWENESNVKLDYANANYTLEIMLLDDTDLIGGYNYNWTYTYEEISQAKEVKFHLLEFEERNNEEMLNNMSEYEFYEMLAPELLG